MSTLKEILNFIIAKTDWMKTFVGLSTIFIFSFMVYSIFHVDLSKTQETIIVHITGVMEGMLVMIVGYYFGSSKGSQDKTEIIKRQNEAATDAAKEASKNNETGS